MQWSTCNRYAKSPYLHAKKKKKPFFICRDEIALWLLLQAVLIHDPTYITITTSPTLVVYNKTVLHGNNAYVYVIMQAMAFVARSTYSTYKTTNKCHSLSYLKQGLSFLSLQELKAKVV